MIAHPTCGALMSVCKNSVSVLQTDCGTPYRIWSADLWECPDCGEQILGGFGRTPVAERWDDDFAALAKSADYTVAWRLGAPPKAQP